MIKQIETLDDVKRLGTILSVWAHPDDETFSCAGIMAAARQNGQKVVCLTATKGEKGVQDESRWPASRLAEIREQELNEALNLLDINEHRFLGFSDGGCGQVALQDGAAVIARYIEQIKPDSLLTFGPDGMTGHSDHQAVSAWVSQAVSSVNNPPVIYHAVELKDNYEKYLKEADKEFDIYFNIDKPPLCEGDECDICFQMPADICRLKCRALMAMPSQTEAMMKVFGDMAEQIFCREAFRRES